MNDASREFKADPIRPEAGTHRVPYTAYTGPALYRREVERLLYRDHGCYRGLEAEIPAIGDDRRTKLGELSTVFNVGRYLDQVVHSTEGLRLRQRLCVYDSELIPNAISYPI